MDFVGLIIGVSLALTGFWAIYSHMVRIQRIEG